MTLEERVAALEQQVAEEARLRASVDRDLADVGPSMRAMRYLIQAISITQGDHTTKLEQHTELLLKLSSGAGGIAAMLEELLRREGEESE